MPRVKRIDHVSVAVNSIDGALPFFSKIFDVKPEKVRRFGGGGDFQGAIFAIGDSKIELLEPDNPAGFVAKFLAKGGGAHHVTVQVEDLAAMRATLKEMGIPTWGKEHDEDNGSMAEAFIHPRDGYGILWQLVEKVWEVQPQD